MKENKKGFSLVEVVVSIFIFVLIVSAVSAIFSDFIVAYRSARALQKNLENAEYAISLMAKNLRTSSIVSGSGTSTSILFYNYSDGGKCISYRVQGNKLQTASANNPGDSEPDKKAWCQSTTFSIYSDVTSTNSVYINSLNFSAVPSDGTSDPKVVGKVTIALEVCPDSACKEAAAVQTSVSLRDYSVSGL